MPDFKNIYSLKIPPGIEQDGTPFSRTKWTAGLWTRFYRGYAYKMGGYTQITQDLPEICRGIIMVPAVGGGSPIYNIFLGTASYCYYFSIDNAGVVQTELTPITPEGFLDNPDNAWTFDLAPYAGVESGTALIANAAPNLGSISNNFPTPVYFTDAYNPTQLQILMVNPLGTVDPPPDPPPPPPVPIALMTDGGVVTLFPFLFTYGSSGTVEWVNMGVLNSVNGLPTIEGSTSVSGLKIVAGTAVRGGNSAPGGLFWALDRLVRATYTGEQSSTPDFSFDPISTETSILSQNAWVEYDSLYYWVAIDRFLMYNGIVQELANSNSLDFFFTNLDFNNKEKVFATKIPHWGEIWWFFPTRLSPNGECNHAVIYNVREQTWYDTPITRSAGTFSQTFPLPIWTDNQLDSVNGYPIWLQESGYDRVDNDPDTPDVIAIPASITTPFISYAASDFDGQQEELDRWTYLYRVEIDCNQAGPMTLTVSGKEYANSDSLSVDYPFPEDTLKIDMREQRRLLQLTFKSDTPGGFYQLGKFLIVATPGDARQ